MTTTTEKTTETAEPEKPKLTHLQEVTIRYLAKGVPTHCGVPARNCYNPATVQVGDCCKVPHYFVTSCEKHIATAVRTVVNGGCEVQVNRMWQDGENTGLIAERRAKTALVTKYQKFVQDLYTNYGAAQHPDKMQPAPQDEQQHWELLGEYTAAKQIVKDIERFRNSLDQRQNP